MTDQLQEAKALREELACALARVDRLIDDLQDAQDVQTVPELAI